MSFLHGGVFHHILQNTFKNATPATHFALCHQLTQPDNAIFQKNTRRDTSEVLRLQNGDGGF